MTTAVFKAEKKDDLKYFVALARRQGILVKYVKTKIERKTDILDEICGKWEDDRPVEEMVNDIYSSRTSGKTRKLVVW